MTKFWLLLLTIVVPANASQVGNIVYNNDLIKTNEIFDLVYAKDSEVLSSAQNQTKYYCVFRSSWNPVNQPTNYPKLARWGDPLMFSHTAQYYPFIKDRAATNGVQHIAESTFTDVFRAEIISAGNLVDDVAEGTGFFVNHKDVNQNFVYLPPLNVSGQFPFLSGIAGMSPSPDWITEWYLFNTVKEQAAIFWDSFLIRSYPFDAGTDSGQHYTDPHQLTDPKQPITRITTANTDLLNGAGDQITYVAEWECVLQTCPIEEPGCNKTDWPPVNGCDILRYPLCTTYCDPAKDTPCEQCKPLQGDVTSVFHASCCDAGRVPKDGVCAVTSTSGTKILSVAKAMFFTVLAFVALR